MWPWPLHSIGIALCLSELDRPAPRSLSLILETKAPVACAKVRYHYLPNNTARMVALFALDRR